MKILRFFGEKYIVLYYIIIVVIFVWQLMTCSSTTYDTDLLGINADISYEIIDSNILESVFRISREAPSGFLIYNYTNSKESNSSQEIHIDFLDEMSGEICESRVVDPTKEIANIYIPFEKKFPIGAMVRMRLWSKGIKDSGPTISLSKSSSYGNALWKNGELTNRCLCAAICYKKKAYNYVKLIIFFVIEIMIGFLLLYMERKLKLPFYVKRKRTILPAKKLQWKRIIFGAIVLNGSAVVFLDYIYTNTVEQAIDQRDYEVICNAEEENIATVPVVLNDGDELVQIFRAQKNQLSGIGIQLDCQSTQNGVIRCCVYDGLSGELLIEKGYQISKLRNALSYVPKEEQMAEDKSTLKNMLFLDLQKVLDKSSKRYYKLVIRAEQLTDKPIMLAVSDGNSPPLEKNSRYFGGSLCLALFYSNNVFLKVMFRWMSFIIIFFIVALFVYINVFHVSVEKVFLVCGLVLGILYCFLIPPYCVPDEWAHFDTAYRVSNEIMGITETPGPERIYKRACDIEGAKFETVNTTVEEYKNLYKELGKRTDNETLQVAYANDTMGQSSLFNYLFTAIGFTIARLLHLGHISLLMLGRMVNLIAMLLLMYVAIRKLPTGKSVFALIGLLPMTLQQMASASYDGFIIAMAHVFVAYTIYIFTTSSDISILDIVSLIFSGCMLAICKAGVYVPILGLLLIVPAGKKTLKKQWTIGIVASLSVMAMIFLAQNISLVLPYFAKTQGTSFRSGTVAVYTVSHFLQFPKELVRIFQNTVRDSGDFYIRGIVGSALGNLNVTFPWFLLIGFVLLLAFSALAQNNEEILWKLDTRIYVGFLCITSVVFVLFSMLIAWTEVSAKSIQGVQGRYFLPILGLGILLFQNHTLVYRKKKENSLVYVAYVLNVAAIGFSLFSVI